MHFLVVLLISFSLWAETLKVQTETPVYQTPATDSHVQFSLKAGERVDVEPAGAEFYKVHVHRGSRHLSGFVPQLELEPAPDARTWAFGLGGQYKSFLQKGKTFQGNDQVQYKTGDYKSSSFAPFVTAQLGELDFWRLEVAYFKTHYTTTAAQDVVTKTQDISLQQTFFMATLQKAWSPFSSRSFYFGLGALIGKATDVTATLGGIPLATGSTDLPLYAGGQVFLGGQHFFSPAWSGFIEARFSVIVNQSPMVIGYDGVAGFMYWVE